MHRTTKIAAKIAALSATTLIASAAVANASVTVTNGTGFVGKGDVQTLFGWNNQTLQENAKNLTFTTVQPAIQSLSQDATQKASQAVTQSVSQDVTCTIEKTNKTFHRDGLRDGSRDGLRDGNRTGSRSGALTGTISYTVDYDARKANQFTGFNLKGSKAPSFAPSGAPVFGDPSFGDWSFGKASFGDVEWGGWEAAPGENPAECLGGNPGVTDLVNTVTDGDIAYGDTTEDKIAYGDLVLGEVTPTGTATLYVNGKALPNTPAV